MCSGLRTNVLHMFCSSVSILSQYGGHYGPNVDFFRRNIKKSSRDCQNILAAVLMHGIDSETLPEHIDFFFGSVFTWPIFISRNSDSFILAERLKSGSG